MAKPKILRFPFSPKDLIWIKEELGVTWVDLRDVIVEVADKLFDDPPFRPSKSSLETWAHEKHSPTLKQWGIACVVLLSLLADFRDRKRKKAKAAMTHEGMTEDPGPEPGAAPSGSVMDDLIKKNQEGG
jgi:hypothetical protein